MTPTRHGTIYFCTLRNTKLNSSISFFSNLMFSDEIHTCQLYVLPLVTLQSHHIFGEVIRKRLDIRNKKGTDKGKGWNKRNET